MDSYGIPSLFSQKNNDTCNNKYFRMLSDIMLLRVLTLDMLNKLRCHAHF